ncbi:MAG: hypothetical protein LBB05_04455 [Puniceicoccales bacterium]|jgi:hypothetical protein|nr:hypothetical protein [Puniceicoccales bacterium]
MKQKKGMRQEDQQNQHEVEESEIRVEKMAKLMLISEKNLPEDCPLYEILKKPFIERILWLEDQTKFSMDCTIAQCEACNGCNLKEISVKI